MSINIEESQKSFKVEISDLMDVESKITLDKQQSTIENLLKDIPQEYLNSYLNEIIDLLLEKSYNNIYFLSFEDLFKIFQSKYIVLRINIIDKLISLIQWNPINTAWIDQNTILNILQSF